VTVFISCTGLFGLSMLSARKREKEISVRKVLGASAAQVVRLVARDFIALVLMAIVIAVPPGWWLINKWLEHFAYHIPVSWWMFAMAALLTLIIATLTIGFQAMKSAAASPARSLRNP
jgi:putative ABC transport system permease protein